MDALVASPAAALSQVPLLHFNAAQALERRMLDTVAGRGAGLLWAVWRTHRALVVPSQTANAPNFYAASLEMEQRGWPVHVRDTGGDVTPQSPGIINATAAFVVPRTKDLSIRATYERFCAPLLAFLRTFGLDAYLSSVERSFCDGAFNIAVDGKKLAGTAQRWRLATTSSGEPGVAVLAHAAILDNPDIELSIAATNLFYGLCGMRREVDPAQHTSLAALIEASGAGNQSHAERLSAFLDRYER